jgi:hypothetical protein
VSTARDNHSGVCGFPKGISHILQWSGKENRDVQCLILGVIAGMENVSTGIIKAVHSCLDFIYLAQLPQHTNAMLQVMQAHLTDYNIARLMYIRNGSCRGKKGVIDNMKFPKSHSPHHIFSNIRDTGIIDNYSTETSETIHIEACKEPWWESNHKDYMQQVIRCLTHHENIHIFSAYLQWHDQSWDESSNDGNEETEPVNGTTHIKIAKVPHCRGIPMNIMADQHSIPGLSVVIVQFELGAGSGLTQFKWGIYWDGDLPSPFAELDIWTSFHISPNWPNELYKQETFTIHCKPATAGSEEFFDSILIHTHEGNNITLKGTQSTTQG